MYWWCSWAPEVCYISYIKTIRNYVWLKLASKLKLYQLPLQDLLLVRDTHISSHFIQRTGMDKNKNKSKNNNNNKNNFILHRRFKITNTSCQLFIDEMIYNIYIQTCIGYIMIKHYINYIDTLAHPMTLLRF